MSASGQAISKWTASAFIWGEVCQGWTLVDAPALHVIQERMPPATYEHRHVHERTHQLYFILEGQATVELDGGRIDLDRQEGLEIRAGTPHRMRNDSDTDIEFLVISSKRPREDRVDL